MNFSMDSDWEAFEYRPGQQVELKSKPGTFDTIAHYDPMMVPSIWLEHDPKPRYPHELRIVRHSWLGNRFGSQSAPTSPVEACAISCAIR